MTKENILTIKALLLAGLITVSSKGVAHAVNNNQNEVVVKKIEINQLINNKQNVSNVQNTQQLESKQQEEKKLRDIVMVNGRGNETSYGEGSFGVSWNNQLMAIVGVQSGREYPFACAIISRNGKLGDVMAWFKDEQLQSTKKYNGIISIMPTVQTQLDDKNNNGIQDENEKMKIVYSVPEGYIFNGTVGIKEEFTNNTIDLNEAELSKSYNIKSK